MNIVSSGNCRAMDKIKAGSLGNASHMFSNEEVSKIDYHLIRSSLYLQLCNLMQTLDDFVANCITIQNKTLQFKIAYDVLFREVLT